MSSKITDKEKAIAYDQIMYSGLITVGATLIAVGLGILITLLSTAEFQLLNLFQDFTTTEGKAKVLFTLTSFIYVGLGATLLWVGLSRTGKKYWQDKHKPETVEKTPLPQGNFMVIIEGSSNETTRLIELATRFADDLGKEPSVILTTARIIGSTRTNNLLDGTNDSQ